MNQSANYMPEHHKNLGGLISKHYDYLSGLMMQAG
jgi:hypothetical protein